MPDPSVLLFAQAEAGAQAQVAQPPDQPPADAGGGTNPFIAFLPFLGPLILIYLLFIRPQQVQERKRRAMIDALKKNDRVLTSAGIYGTVVAIDTDSDRVVLRVDDERGVKIPFSRSSIYRVLNPSSDKEKDKAPEPAAESGRK